ncbi:MAG: translocase [Bryobacteraceae bacterium]|nr:translocase [Bryobacteraceae bacterium]
MTINAQQSGAPAKRGPIERLLSPLAEVRAGEGATVLMMAATMCGLLAAYYFLKSAREPLILTQGGAAVKTYSSAGQAFLLALLIPLYSSIASKVRRIQLVGGLAIFFLLNLVLFVVLGMSGVREGVAYFIWVGIFNVFVISQFWAFANDLYSEDQGKRLFPIVGLGASLGAFIGAKAAEPLAKQKGPYVLMISGGLLLAVSVGLLYAVYLRERPETRPGGAKKLAGGDGFALVMRDRYLVLIAALIVMLNVVNTSGEFILSEMVTSHAQATYTDTSAEEKFIGGFYANYYSWFNLLSLLLQTFFVSRVFKYIGVAGALFLLPGIALVGYLFFLVSPILGVARWLKIAENSVDYSVQNTSNQALFLVTSPEVKYKAKAAIDTFFMRLGDVLQAAIVYFGLQLGMGVKQFAMLNLALIAVWSVAVFALAKEYRQRAIAQ